MYTHTCTYYRLSPFIRPDVCSGAHPRGGRGAGLHPPSNQNFKSMDFVDTMILNVMRGLPLRQNQSLQSAVDRYIRILKNKIINLGCCS